VGNLSLDLIGDRIKEIIDFYIQVKRGLGAPEMDLALGAGGYQSACAGAARLVEPLHLYFL
jgi:hypothetical protein